MDRFLCSDCVASKAAVPAELLASLDTARIYVWGDGVADGPPCGREGVAECPLSGGEDACGFVCTP